MLLCTGSIEFFRTSKILLMLNKTVNKCLWPHVISNFYEMNLLVNSSHIAIKQTMNFNTALLSIVILRSSSYYIFSVFFATRYANRAILHAVQTLIHTQSPSKYHRSCYYIYFLFLAFRIRTLSETSLVIVVLQTNSLTSRKSDDNEWRNIF